MDIATAIMKTVRSILGPANLGIGLTRAGDTKAAEKIKAAGANVAVEKPISLRLLAQILSKSVVTDAISTTLNPNAVLNRDTSKEQNEAPLPDLPLPEIIGWHFEKLMPVLARLSSSLEKFDDIEHQFNHFVELLAPWRSELVAMIKSLRKSEDALDLMQSLRLYGSINARAMAISLNLANATNLVTFGFNSKTGLPTQDPRKVIPYAMRAAEHFGEDSRYFQTALNAGLILDILSYFAQTAGDRKGNILRTIENSFGESMKRIDRGFKSAKALKDLAQDQHLISVILMRDAGKILMTLFFPDYFERKNAFEKKAIRPSLQHVAENKIYGISHNVVGALICQVAPGLESAYKAVLFYDYPFMLKSSRENKDAFALASLCQTI